jgi:hypothetical protein
MGLGGATPTTVLPVGDRGGPRKPGEVGVSDDTSMKVHEKRGKNGAPMPHSSQ